MNSRARATSTTWKLFQQPYFFELPNTNTCKVVNETTVFSESRETNCYILPNVKAQKSNVFFSKLWLYHCGISYLSFVKNNQVTRIQLMGKCDKSSSATNIRNKDRDPNIKMNKSTWLKIFIRPRRRSYSIVFDILTNIINDSMHSCKKGRKNSFK